MVVVLPDEERGGRKVPPLPRGGLPGRYRVGGVCCVCGAYVRAQAFFLTIAHPPTRHGYVDRAPTASPRTTCRWCSADAASSPTSKSPLRWAGTATRPSRACLARRSTRAPTSGSEFFLFWFSSSEIEEWGREGKGRERMGKGRKGRKGRKRRRMEKSQSFIIQGLNISHPCQCVSCPVYHFIGGVALK